MATSISISDLQEKVEAKQAIVAVIGLGYVGLPVACMFARAGFNVIGVEIQAERTALINQGISPIEGVEPGLGELLREVVSTGRLHATADYSELRNCDVVLIDVETPVDENNIPRYEALRSALNSLGAVLHPGILVIIESTIAPGTIRDVVLPILETSSGLHVNEDFYLGNCPERVMPGKLLANLEQMSRVAGGMSPETSNVMISLYRHIVHADLDAADCITAEIVKTAENAYRDVQIAFANELALICQAVGGDVWQVRRLVNKSPGRQVHYPGAGVGGHCIPKDPWLLAYGVKESGVTLQVIPAARAVNEAMPHHIVALLQDALEEKGIPIEKATILVMGYAYLEDSDDTRNSPSEVFVNHMREISVNLIIHDPFVPGYRGDLFEMAKQADAAVVMVAHSMYKTLDMVEFHKALRAPVLVDGRAVFATCELEKQGWVYRCIGKA